MDPFWGVTESKSHSDILPTIVPERRTTELLRLSQDASNDPLRLVVFKRVQL